MFSITLKRSAATLGVVAGLLAAAGPASAAGPGSISGEEMTKAILSVKAPGPRDTGSATGLFPLENIQITSVKAPQPSEDVDAGTQIGIED